MTITWKVRSFKIINWISSWFAQNLPCLPLVLRKGPDSLGWSLRLPLLLRPHCGPSITRSSPRCPTLPELIHQALSLKGQIISTSISVITIQLCCSSKKAATDNTWAHGWGRVPIKLYCQKRRGRLVHRLWLADPALLAAVSMHAAAAAAAGVTSLFPSGSFPLFQASVNISFPGNSSWSPQEGICFSEQQSPV